MLNTNDLSKGVVLVVEDTPHYLQILGEYLEIAGFKVFLELGSQNAVQKAEEVQPDLILLDIRMPKIDGFEVCRRLKAQETTNHIPVMFMTALTERENMIKAFQAGAVDYVTKPFQQAELLARVNAHVMIRKLQQQLEAKNALLEKQVEQLQEANATKDKFISMISHDLQSPFSSLRGLIQFTSENLATYNVTELENILGLLGSSTDNLYALIENLLTWSRIQRGVMEHHPQKLDLQNIVAQNMDLFTPTAGQKQIALTHQIPEHLFVYADVNMLNAVLRNLLSNALKFTKHEGTITISAQDVGDCIEISVADTGIGIAAEHVSKLFRIDARYKRLGTDREKGTGFGLVLCKEFVEKHGGKIWIESQPDQGTTARFTLPKNPANHDGNNT